MFFQAEALFEIAKLVGNPLRMDQATAHRTVLMRARVCVEVDSSKSLPTTIFVDVHGLMHVVDVIYDEFPHYCTFCSKLGHDIGTYFKKHPELKPVIDLETVTNDIKASDGFQKV